jgi:hypothetical protein
MVDPVDLLRGTPAPPIFKAARLGPLRLRRAADGKFNLEQKIIVPLKGGIPRANSVEMGEGL